MYCAYSIPGVTASSLMYYYNGKAVRNLRFSSPLSLSLSLSGLLSAPLGLLSAPLCSSLLLLCSSLLLSAPLGLLLSAPLCSSLLLSVYSSLLLSAPVRLATGENRRGWRVALVRRVCGSMTRPCLRLYGQAVSVALCPGRVCGSMTRPCQRLYDQAVSAAL
ncbi:hypothetical protein NHX12_026865 [Muraenolepis orangiensis]|uniref:Uncharacterized protein n=1 Tax=Muraenolepis orangiensis TaxID=630683 RepID=A0A9Q0INP9_9TELE|nr:hypothetical protein NHX12_026865 [Muraenolepis orangiensis]